jgi:hypothetical protein
VEALYAAQAPASGDGRIRKSRQALERDLAEVRQIARAAASQLAAQKVPQLRIVEMKAPTRFTRPKVLDMGTGWELGPGTLTADGDLRTGEAMTTERFIRSLSWPQAWAEKTEKARYRAGLRTDAIVLSGLRTESLLDPDRYKLAANGEDWSFLPYGESLFRYRGELFISLNEDHLPVPFAEHFASYLKKSAEPQV